MPTTKLFNSSRKKLYYTHTHAHQRQENKEVNVVQYSCLGNLGEGYPEILQTILATFP